MNSHDYNKLTGQTLWAFKREVMNSDFVIPGNFKGLVMIRD